MKAQEPVAIEVVGLGKSYSMLKSPADRLLQLLLPKRFHGGDIFTALEDVSFTLRRGEVLGIIGVNGAGKSTLLQLVTGTITPTTGNVKTQGRVASILELGAGFNPEFTGRENVYLNAATMGLSKSEIDARLESIIEFASIGRHIDHPVKTYSSGMLVRLAFAVASSVEPDILIIDEALSVGDGAFRRRSFDRIMEIKSKGATILFCSHVMFHVETFCDQVIWLHRGQVQLQGAVDKVLPKYQEFLEIFEADPDAAPLLNASADKEYLFDKSSGRLSSCEPLRGPRGEARFDRISISLDGREGVDLHGLSMRSELCVEIDYTSDPGLPPPTAALVISSESGKILGSCFSHQGGDMLSRSPSGAGSLRITLDRLNLNKGIYRVGVYLFCERGMHGYAMSDPAATINLHHDGPEQGAWILNPKWISTPLDVQSTK